MSIKRFAARVLPVSDEDGAWVSYTDHIASLEAVKAELASTIEELIDHTGDETMLAAYLEARGAVLVPEKMTMPMLNAVMKFHRSLPAGKQTIAASTEYQTAELVWDAALSALSDNPKGDGNGR